MSMRSADPPTSEIIDRLLALQTDGPVQMLNLLKLKPETGKASFRAYSEAIAPILANIGARSIFAGRYRGALMGDGDWDTVVIVQYPSAQAFIDMVTSEEYQAIYHHRDDALAAAELHVVTPLGSR